MIPTSLSENPLRRLVTSAAVALGILSASWALAAITTFIDSLIFSASLPTGNYVNNTWNGLDGFATGSRSFSGGSPTIEYTARNNVDQQFLSTLFIPRP